MPPQSEAAENVAAGAATPVATSAEIIPLTTEQIPRAPWSEVAPDFIAAWGYPDGKRDPEFVEILGPSGSGKTRFEATILSERVAARGSHCIFVATKKADKSILELGWPVVSDWNGVQQHDQCIFWPQTRALGTRRKAYLAAKIEDLLSRLWHPDANIVIAFDEIATIEALSPEVKDLISMYWREGRSLGITIVAMKQRPQGVQRDMHSEAAWVVSFRPKDEDDAKRYAELFGSRKQYQPVLMSLDRTKYEFLIQHARSGMAVISWIDVPIEPLPKKQPYGRR
jgi:nucleoside-triphosphatase THEP1